MRKVLTSFFILILFLIKFSYADQKVVFINVDKIINESDFGNKSFKKIDSDFEKEKKKLLEIEKKLVTKEQEILKQKNILSEEELNKKIKILKKEINDFQIKRASINKKFSKMKLEKSNYMVQNLNTILSEYADENEISLIVQKKYIVIGKSGLDITDKVMDIFNKKVKN